LIKYLLRRALGWLLMIVVATNVTYFLAWAFLDPRSNYVGRRPPLSEDQINRLLEPRNLSDTVPLLERWWHWFTDIVLHWNWGVSPVGQSVNDQIAYRMWVSGELVLGATIITAVLGIAIGVYTASRQYKVADRVWQGISIVTMNIPIIVAALGIVIIAIAINDALGFRLFYVTGARSDGVTGFFPVLIDTLQHLILPTIALVFIGYSSYHFLQRSLLLDNIKADYVRTARAKGLTKPQASDPQARAAHVADPRRDPAGLQHPHRVHRCGADRDDLRVERHGPVLRADHRHQRCPRRGGDRRLQRRAHGDRRHPRRHRRGGPRSASEGELT